jgi:hypothetical protein
VALSLGVHKLLNKVVQKILVLRSTELQHNLKGTVNTLYENLVTYENMFLLLVSTFNKTSTWTIKLLMLQ